MTKIPREPSHHKGRDKGYVRVAVSAPGQKKKYRQIYFRGKWRSKEMWDHFESWCYEQQGLQEPETLTLGQSERRPHREPKVTVGNLCDHFLADLKEKRNYGQPEETKKDRGTVTLAIRTLALLEKYRDMNCNGFTAEHLAKVRRVEIRSGNSRKTINEKIQLIVRMFRKASHKETVGCKPETWWKLLAWEKDERLGDDDKHVPGPRDVHAAEWADVEKVIKAANPTIACMIMVQAHTGMRSENVAELSYAQIDKSRWLADDVWIYTPTHHKTEGDGHTLEVVMGPVAIQAILDYERVRPDAGHPFLFNPRATWTWRYFNEHLGKRSWQSFYKASKKKNLNPHFSTDTYGDAVERIRLRVGVHWTPHQLRHLHNERVVESQFGDAGAASVLGHTTLASTRNYSKTQDKEKAIRVQKTLG